jgi:hypothetical protein
MANMMIERLVCKIGVKIKKIFYLFLGDIESNARTNVIRILMRRITNQKKSISGAFLIIR